eukprot:scaffold1812_cov181-Alexandrium_tamarense.AAC.17
MPSITDGVDALPIAVDAPPIAADAPPIPADAPPITAGAASDEDSLSSEVSRDDHTASSLSAPPSVSRG